MVQNQKGFTMVELMIVIAIIGILAAVAAPNLKTYQAKSKSAEAKLQLAAAYAAMQTFYGEYGIYHNCLAVMGYNPTNEVDARYFAVGIDQTAAVDPGAYTNALNSGLNSTLCPAGNASAAGNTWFPAGKGTGSSVVVALDGGSSIGDQSSAVNQTFVIQADGVISADFTSTVNRSKYTVDQDKAYSLISTGY